MQVCPMSFYVGTYEYGKYNGGVSLWIDRWGQRLDTKTCNAFHIGVVDPFFEKWHGQRRLHRLPISKEGKCRMATVPLKTVVRLRGKEAVNR